MCAVYLLRMLILNVWNVYGIFSENANYIDTKRKSPNGPFL